MPTTIHTNLQTAELEAPSIFALIESLPDAAFIMKPDGLIQAINSLFASRFGKTPEECRGKSIYDLIIHELRVPLLAGYLEEKCASVIKAARSIVFDDDTDIWKVSISPIVATPGTIASLFVSIQDTSEQKRAEKRLRTERELRNALLDAIPCSATILDADLQLIASNRYAEEVLFSTDNDRNRVETSGFFNQEDMASLKKKFRQTLKTGKENYCEMQVRPHGGDEQKWIMTRSMRIVIDGKPCVVSIGLDISERKKIEEDLNGYQTKLSLALQATHAGIWEWHPKKGEVDWSDDVWSIFGIEKSRHQPSIDLFKKVMYPYDLKKISRAISEAARTKNHIDVEYRIGLPDGSTRWIMSRGKPVFDHEGKIDRYIGTIIDITERKLLEEDLRKNKAMFEQALSASRAGVWERDIKTNKVTWSDTMWSLYGLDVSHEAPSVDLWKAIIHPEDREKAIKSADEATGSGAELNIEYRIHHANGSTRWFMSRGMPVLNEDGSFDKYIGTIIDITDRKLLEQELLESKIRYGYALDAAHAGIWEWNVETDELSWSDQIWRLYGLTSGSRPLNHQLCVDTIHPEDRATASKLIKDAVKNVDSAAVEYRAIHPDGSVHWLTSRGMPMFDANGKLVRYLGTIIDITERKQIELELIENRKRLSQALEAARAGVWEWNMVTGENIWSDEIWSLYGLSPTPGVNPSFNLWASAIHPEDREMAIRVVTEASSKQSDLSVEYRTLHPDGSVHWLMSRGKPRQEESGETVGYVGTIIDITERKTAEIELNESKFRFNFALEATGAGVWEWDFKTDRVSWSEQIWKLYGLKPYSVTPSHKLCESNVYAEDRDLTFETIISAANRNVDFGVEYRVRHPDGSIHWLMCRGVPLNPVDGEACTYLGTVMDVTNRKKAEEEWRKSQEQLNFVIQKGSIGIWTLNLKDFTAQRTIEHARIFGYDSINTEWTFDRFIEHIVPEERDAVRSKIEKCVKSHENFTVECRIRTADKRLRWIWLFGAFSYDSTARIHYLSGIVQDITVRKQAELLLKESEQKFRNIFEFSPVAIGIGDFREGVLFDVNASWLRLLGYSREEVIGRRLNELGVYLHPEDHHDIMHDLQEFGRVSNRQLELRHRSGKSITILFSAESITITGQNNLLLMMTDITVQELQQASISQLEQAVADRTEQLQEDVERLHRFLSMISHEYRTPLAIIRGNLDLITLKHKGGDYSQQREMNKIKRAIERLVEVMEVSIQESRILESREALTVTNFKLDPAIVSQIEAFQSMWPEKAVHYSSHLNGTEIVGEPGQFKMAIFNLLDNARKYSPLETPIEMESHIDNGEVIITIRNQGKSINRVESEGLFEKYRRGSNAANTGGAGIGLWLVKDIIEHHHGRVSLSGIESGVEAVVNLPLAGKKD
jgi:PAS domain S-box-containing protein